MSLKIIGAGFGRTGTESLKTALEMLGFGPCHHMVEVLPSPDQMAAWVDVARGGPPDWDRIFDGYRSAVDWPSAFYWRELAEYYPEAKVILSVRPANQWFESMDRTILSLLRERTPGAIGFELITKQVFNNELDDREHVISAYERNNAEVKATFPPERLLVFSPGDGWEPLCRFLDVPVPAVDYPHSNTRATFHGMVEELQTKGEANRS